MKYIGKSAGMMSKMARSIKKSEDKTVQSLQSPASPKEGQVWRNPKDGKEYTYSSALKKWVLRGGEKGADGQNGQDGQNASYKDYIFKRSDTQPATPTEDSPPDWSDGPPTGTNALWISVAIKSFDGVVQGAWSVPVQLNGENGQDGANGIDGDSVFIEYSVDGVSNWHITFANGDIFMRQKVGQSGAWSEAVKIIGENGQDGINGQDGANGNFKDHVFKRSDTQPATPTGDNPATWSDGPPTGTSALWISVATKSFDGIVQGVWSTPIRLNGDNGTNGVNGTDGSSVFIEYSITGTSSWHSTFTDGDKYMRQKIGVNGIWSSAAKIIGENGANGANGNFKDNIFKRSDTQPATPTGNTPAGWSDGPPTGTNALWISVAIKSYDGIVQGVWSTPVRLNGQDGTSGANGTDGNSVFVEYSIDGNTVWHSVFVSGDKYMRQKVGTSGTWSSAVKIVGENGTNGTNGTNGVNGTDGASVFVEYSINGSTLWHSAFASGDKYMRQKTGASGTWSSSIKMVGENGTDGQNGINGTNGGYTSYVFKRSSTQPGVPTGDIPSGWSDAPPANNGMSLWMASGVKNASGVLQGVWSTPVQLNGNDGVNGQNGINGINGTNGQDGQDASKPVVGINFFANGQDSFSWDGGDLWINGNYYQTDTGTITNMAEGDMWYIYFDETTLPVGGVYPLSASYFPADSVGATKTLLAVATANGDTGKDAVFSVFNGIGGNMYVQGTNISNNSISTEHLQANSVTSDKIVVNTLSAISAYLGNIIGGTIQTAGADQRVFIQDDDIKWQKKDAGTWKDCGVLRGALLQVWEFIDGGMSGIFNQPGIEHYHTQDAPFVSKVFSGVKMWISDKLSANKIACNDIYVRDQSTGTFRKLYAIKAGTNVTISTNPTTNEITINASGGSSSWVGTATSNLNMNNFEINGISKIKLPVGTNLY